MFTPQPSNPNMAHRPARSLRTRPDTQVARIAGSTKTFGFKAPNLVDSNAGVIGGRGRLSRARQLRLEEVPVIVLDHLSATAKRVDHR